MNILDLNERIYARKDFKQDEYANFMIDSIQQQTIKYNLSNNEDKFYRINTEIKI